jgi:hypothetical protein
MNPKETFKMVETVLVIDWPSKAVPERVTVAGFHVVVRGGPGPEGYSVYALNNGEIVTRHVDRAPDRADLIYSHRPFRELPEIHRHCQRTSREDHMDPVRRIRRRRRRSEGLLGFLQRSNGWLETWWRPQD